MNRNTTWGEPGIGGGLDERHHLDGHGTAPILDARGDLREEPRNIAQQDAREAYAAEYEAWGTYDDAWSEQAGDDR